MPDRFLIGFREGSTRHSVVRHQRDHLVDVGVAVVPHLDAVRHVRAVGADHSKKSNDRRQGKCYSEARSATNVCVWHCVLEQPKLEEALKEIPMFPLTRIQFLKFAAAGAFVALSVASTPASADEMVQNLGPVGPNEAVLATIGSTHLIAFFEPGGGRCALNAVVWDNLTVDAGKSAKRVRVSIEPGQIVHIDTAEQQSLHLQCGSNAATLAVIDTDALSASGITAQPPGQPVKPGF